MLRDLYLTSEVFHCRLRGLLLHNGETYKAILIDTFSTASILSAFILFSLWEYGRRKFNCRSEENEDKERLSLQVLNLTNTTYSNI
jgi:hypothetical protein